MSQRIWLLQSVCGASIGRLYGNIADDSTQKDETILQDHASMQVDVRVVQLTFLNYSIRPASVAVQRFTRPGQLGVSRMTVRPHDW